MQQKTILLDFYDLNFNKIQKNNSRSIDENELIAQDNDNISPVNGSFSLDEQLYFINKEYTVATLGDNFSNNSIINKSLYTKNNAERGKGALFKNSSSINECLSIPLSNSFYLQKKQKLLNGNLSRNLKKSKEDDNKDKFSTLNEKLNNKNNVINYSSLSFEDINNTNQLFLKENSNYLSKLNISKKK